MSNPLKSKHHEKSIFLSLLGLISVSLFFSCANDVLLEEIAGQEIPVDDMAILNSLGFAESSIEDMGDYYLAEGDIAIPEENLQTYVGTRQAYTNIVVSVDRASNIKVRIDNGLKNSSNWEEAILAALNHYNNIIGPLVLLLETMPGTQSIIPFRERVYSKPNGKQMAFYNRHILLLIQILTSPVLIPSSVQQPIQMGILL